MKQALFEHGDRAALIKYALDLERENEILTTGFAEIKANLEDFKAKFANLIADKVKKALEPDLHIVKDE